MSRNQLQDGEIALLGKLNRQPLELGDLPVEAVARLTQLGLARKVLGYCEITRAGQLTYKRDHFRKHAAGRATRKKPLSLFSRRTVDTDIRNNSVSSRWTMWGRGTAKKTLGN